MSKIKVYIVHRCEDEHTPSRIIGIYLNREDAMIKVKRLQEDLKNSKNVCYYAILKKTLKGDYWLSSKSGLMFINGRRVKKVIRNYLGE